MNMLIIAGLTRWPCFREAWAAVATAKIDEFAYQCRRLATLADYGAVDRSEAAAVLADIAEANSLGDVFGRDVVGNMISDAFSAAVAEAAE